MSDYVIETKGLTRKFGRHTAVDHLSLRVPRGSVFAFLGRNGAGQKPPTIRMLLNQLEADFRVPRACWGWTVSNRS